MIVLHRLIEAAVGSDRPEIAAWPSAAQGLRDYSQTFNRQHRPTDGQHAVVTRPHVTQVVDGHHLAQV